MVRNPGEVGHKLPFSDRKAILNGWGDSTSSSEFILIIKKKKMGEEIKKYQKEILKV